MVVVAVVVVVDGGQKGHRRGTSFLVAKPAFRTAEQTTGCNRTSTHGAQIICEPERCGIRFVVLSQRLGTGAPATRRVGHGGAGRQDRTELGTNGHVGGWELGESQRESQVVAVGRVDG